MEAVQNWRRCLPTIYTSGTFYQVGYDVGSTFKSMIQDYIAEDKFLHEEILPALATAEGRYIYDKTLESLEQKFPHYLRELKGIADGAAIQYETIVLMHMDGIISKCVSGNKKGEWSGNGCSTVLCNQEDVTLGHTEDAFTVALNRCYVVHADIKEEIQPGVWISEKFSSFCYAGHLPGFCMSYNGHGLVFSINIIEPINVAYGKTPRFFLTRALLRAANLEQAQQILWDRGAGSAEGFCVNMTFLAQEGPIVFHSAEVGPAYEADESQLSILTVTTGESHVHCNKYLRLCIPEDPDNLATCSSTARHSLVDSLRPPKTCSDVQEILSDDSDTKFPLFRRPGSGIVVTVATGVFDCKQKLWKLYVGKSNASEPIAIFPLIF